MDIAFLAILYLLTIPFLFCLLALLVVDYVFFVWMLRNHERYMKKQGLHWWHAVFFFLRFAVIWNWKWYRFVFSNEGSRDPAVMRKRRAVKAWLKRTLWALVPVIVGGAWAVLFVE